MEKKFMNLKCLNVVKKITFAKKYKYKRKFHNDVFLFNIVLKRKLFVNFS